MKAIYETARGADDAGDSTIGLPYTQDNIPKINTRVRENPLQPPASSWPQSKSPVEMTAAEWLASDEHRLQQQSYRDRVLAAMARRNARLASSAPKDRRWAADQDAKAALATKPRRVRSQWPLEREEQAALVRWLKAHQIHYNANLEGVARHFQARLAAVHAGMRRGRPDIEILTPPPLRPDVRGVALELKRVMAAKPQVTDEQVERLEQYRADGWLAEVRYGCDDAVRWLVALGYGR